MPTEKRLQEIEARKAEIRGLLEGDGEVDLDALETELKALIEEEAELRRRQEMATSIANGTATARVVERSGLRPQISVESRVADPHDTLEYRQAFMRYVTRGERSDALEFRADETTLPSDI